MSLTSQKGDVGGELSPFPHTAVLAGQAAPVSTVGAGAEETSAVEAAAPVFDGELITKTEYQRSRARQLAESERCPVCPPSGVADQSSRQTGSSWQAVRSRCWCAAQRPSGGAWWCRLRYSRAAAASRAAHDHELVPRAGGRHVAQ